MTIPRIISVLGLLLSAISGYANNIVFVHSDHMGSPIVETDSTGQILNQYHYEPYGTELLASNSDNDVNYTGHVLDEDTGLLYMQARFYDPLIGRFLSDDPVGYQFDNPVFSFNRYAYANNNPYRYIDPDGRRAVTALTAWIKRLIRKKLGNNKKPSDNKADKDKDRDKDKKEDKEKDEGDIKGLGKGDKVTIRTTRQGDPAVKITREDGTVIDISPNRVKEFKPNNHPKAPPGALQKIKFENSLPGSKGFKREPTQQELDLLKDLTK